MVMAMVMLVVVVLVLGWCSSAHPCSNVVVLGPLQAIVKAQTLASKMSTDFITEVGLENGKVKTVDFGYTSHHVDGTTVQRVMKVPLLSIVPIPNLEVSPC